MFPLCLAILQSTCPSSPMYGFHTQWGISHWQPQGMKKQVRKSTGSCFLFLLEIPALWSTWQFIALFYQLFLLGRCLIPSSRPSFTQHETNCGSWRVCAGTSSSWCGSSISGASLVQLHRGMIWGRGPFCFLSQAVDHRPNSLHSGCRTHCS